jgi:hypothetical protein
LPEVELLVGSYQRWCQLLCVQLHIGKTELWCSALPGGRRVTLQLESGPLVLETRATFRMVGIELGASEQVATTVHLASRLPKAQLSARRLAALSVPLPVANQLWSSVVLPQLLYGCEIRNLTFPHVLPVWAQGKTTLPRLPPLCLSHFAAAEVLGGLPLGACAIRDPRLEMTLRRLRWLQLLGNHPGMVGTLHRYLASPRASTWEEPSPSLVAALNVVGWRVRCNREARCAQHWPRLDPEPRYLGGVHLTPVDSPAPRDTVWTDGSVGHSGGAAALQWYSDFSFLATVPQPRSSTHCELVALTLVARFHPAPSLVLTDSLSSLQLIQSWGRRSPGVVLACPERLVICQFLYHWASFPTPPVLEKFTAHDDAAAAKGSIKATGNVAVDALAKQAATGSVGSAPPTPCHEDAVQLCSAAGAGQLLVTSSAQAAWWLSASQAGGSRRTWLALLYPPGLDLDWPASTVVFSRPHVEEHGFVFSAAPPVLKWVARARSGALNTRARLVRARLSTSPRCLCCSADLEDDKHAIVGCPATGSADLSLLLPDLWTKACGATPCVPLPPGWVTAHLIQLAVGLLPLSLRGLLRGVATWQVSIILRTFHLGLCERLAEVLRRREQIMDEMATALIPSPTSSVPPPSSGPSSSSSRVLSVAELRAAEQSAPSLPPPAPAHPHSRAFRAQKQTAALSLQTWVKEHPHLQAVPLVQGEPSVALLLLWEADHQQLYPCGKADLAPRLNYFSKRLVDAVAADSELSGWLPHGRTRTALSKGLRPTSHTRWAVRIRPTVGPSFLQAWKTYLGTLVYQQQHRPLSSSSAGASARSSPRPRPAPATMKRARTGAPPPVQNKKARVERLLAAQTVESARAPGGGSSSSASSPGATVEHRFLASEAAGPLTLPRGLT